MSKLYIEEVLTKKQKAVFAKLKPLKPIGVLAGGTALAFQLKHIKVKITFLILRGNSEVFFQRNCF